MQLLEQYRNQKPAIVFEWYDAPTGAEGWVVINSLRGGAAGGGTRMRKGLNRQEVEALAKIMEIKFSVSGPDIGGAKSGINFDPHDPRKEEVLQRWFRAVMPLLKHYYGTGGDLNIDEMRHVIPLTEDLGLWHPQEGIVNGHFQPRESDKIHYIGQLRYGVSKVIEDPDYAPQDKKYRYTVADMITGYGVAESVKHYYNTYRQTDLRGKRVVVQGWGNVAGAAGYYLAQEGAKLVGIIDREHGIIAPEGLDFAEVRQLMVNREGNQLTDDHPKMMPYAEASAQFWDLSADIFIPGAASKLVHQHQLDRLLDKGLQVIACGANDPFFDNDLFFGTTAQYADQHCSVIPDFIANCGMARIFAYLMQRNVRMSDRALFRDVSATIGKAIAECHAQNSGLHHLSKTAFDIALHKLIAS
ncbi:MAG: Glu/Leu/Phe/Val dehydrogenase [Sphingobacteriales bacterium]|nr:Glu/Leu/Phe/Val dehydrogenase [Sphingobacteriales bacterium]